MEAKFEVINKAGELPPIKKPHELHNNQKYMVLSIKKIPTAFGERIVVNLLDDDNMPIAVFLPIRMVATFVKNPETLFMFDNLSSQGLMYMSVSGLHKSKEISFGLWDEK